MEKDEKKKERNNKTRPGLPLISIITVVLNEKDLVSRAIREVRNQTYPHKQHIIIDGGSTDGTIDILKENQDDIDYWISEKDAGIYDAMNKGVEAADGKWLYFFGADDAFFSRDTLELLFRDPPFIDDVIMLLGNVIKANGSMFKSQFGKSLYFKNTIHHQGVFYRKEVFDNFRYSTPVPSGSKRDYQISGDYELNLMLFLERAKHIYVNRVIARCGSGISMQGKLAGYVEEILIRHEHIGFFKSILFDVGTIMRYVYKKVW